MLRSPAQLTALSITCSLVSVAGFVSSNRPAVHTHLPLLAACFASVVVGYLGMLWSSSTLRDNIRNDRWPAEALAPFRRVIDHVLWKIAVALLLVAMFVSLVAKGRHHQSWFWAVFFLLQAQTQVANAFARPRTPAGTGAHIDWSNVAPLHSEHWGER